MTWTRYAEKLTGTGGIVEELIAGRDFRSPSAQLRITPLGDVEALSMQCRRNSIAALAWRTCGAAVRVRNMSQAQNTG